MKEILKKYRLVFEIAFLSLVVFVSIFQFNNYTQNYLLSSEAIITSLEKIKSKELRLNYEVLKNNIFLYYNNDKIVKAIDDLNNEINKLSSNKLFKIYYPKEYKKFLQYKKIVNNKISIIYELQTLNSAMKNSIIFFNRELNILSNILLDEIKNKKLDINDFIFFQKVNSFVVSLFLSRNAIDSDLLETDINFIKNYTSSNEKINQFKHLLVIHMNIVLRNYPKYVEFLKAVVDEISLELIQEIKSNIFKLEQEKIKVFKVFGYMLGLFILLISIVIIYLLIRREKDKNKLKELVAKLKYIVNIDYLTGLYNRMKFNKDVRLLKKPVLLIINIDKFKNFNDIYGSRHGDLLLKKVAKFIKKTTPKNLNAKFYRLGADDFGILYEKDKKDSVIFAYEMKKKIESTSFKIKNFSTIISVSIGISDIPPLIDNADIALKTIKKDRRKSVLKYYPELDIRPKIEENIKKYNTLYKALKENRIVPVFQPIVKLENKEVVKYEVLARLENNGKLESIYPYLQVAKENKLYNQLTLQMFEKAYDYLKHKDVEFSLNLSIDDIMDEELMREIYKKYKNCEILKRVTFEILESEAIEDYDYVEKFIKMVKQNNIKIALDDFGSGYSNFSHILNLDIDFIKIDGSLIKDITTNEKSYQLVKLIVDFAKQNNIQTIAEFVENEDIYKVLSEIGVEYGQGYYFSPPLSKI